MRSATFPRLWLGGVLMLFSVTAMAENAVTTDVASVRAGPDDSYPEVAQLDPDSPIQVVGCLDDWSWCDVVFGDDRGWLYAPDISYQYEGGYVPFYTYAPSFGLPVLTFSVDAYWGSHYRGRPWYAQRDEWVHRTVQHQRPPGPAPSHAAPPREVVRTEKPHGGSRPGESPLHLSRAEPGHRDEDRSAAGRAPDDGHAPDRRGSSEARPQERGASPSHEERAPSHEQHAPSQHDQHAPAPHEQHAPPAEHAPPQPPTRESRPMNRAGPQREEHSHPAEKPQSQHAEPHGSAKPESHKDENDHRG
jgi:uncharacterized protein YraI